MNKVGYISYHNDGNKLQLDNVLNSKEKLRFVKTGILKSYLSVSSSSLGSRVCCHLELKD